MRDASCWKCRFPTAWVVGRDRDIARLRAPSRGQRRPGVGRIRQAVERCHNFFAQFGRIGRRLDRSAKRFLGWIQLAACLIFLHSDFVR